MYIAFAIHPYWDIFETDLCEMQQGTSFQVSYSIFGCLSATNTVLPDKHDVLSSDQTKVYKAGDKGLNK